MTVGSGEEETKNVKKHKEKEEMMTKIVLRRLPPGIGPDELRAQFAPLPADEPHTFWYCAATGSRTTPQAVGDDTQKENEATTTVATAEDEADEVAATLRRTRCAFARAYLVFREEKNALSFAERFNGYVFVDKNGIESMAIVELAPNQTVPKHSCETAKQCDERVDTLANDVSFLKFMKRREAAETAAAADADGGSRWITDFDELVRQLEEKRRRLEEGQVQETPLTEYIRRMALEKARSKPRRRSALGAGAIPELLAPEQSAKEQQQGHKRCDEGGKSAVTMAQKNTAVRTKTRRERRRRKEQREKIDGGENKKVVADGEEGKKSMAEAEAKSAIRIKIRKSRRRGSDGGDGVGSALGVASSTLKTTAPAGGKEDGAVPSAAAAAVGSMEGRSGAKRGTDNVKKSALAPRSGEPVTIKGARRNKERPEREIYRPGQRKTVAASVKSSSISQNPSTGSGEGAE